jgi:hypothetical protein
VAAARPNIDSGADAWAAASGRVFDVHEPFSGQLYARVAYGFYVREVRVLIWEDRWF